MGLPDFTSYTAIQGIDEGGNYQVLLVDSSGRIVGVFKGDYGGVLKTIAVDDEGRLKSVIVDAASPWVDEQSFGLAELAARLGSSLTFDRRGIVTWYNSFENGLTGFGELSAYNGATGKLSVAQSRRGTFSYHLYLDNQADSGMDLSWFLPHKSEDVVGWEFSFACAKDDSIIEWNLLASSQTHREQAGIYYDWTNETLYYMKADTSYAQFATGVKAYNRASHFNTGKLVIDTNNKTYLRFLFNDRVWNLSAYALNSTSGSYAPGSWAGCIVDNINSVSSNIYLDDMILTGLEPENPT